MTPSKPGGMKSFGREGHRARGMLRNGAICMGFKKAYVKIQMPGEADDSFVFGREYHYERVTIK